MTLFQGEQDKAWAVAAAASQAFLRHTHTHTHTHNLISYLLVSEFEHPWQGLKGRKSRQVVHQLVSPSSCFSLQWS